MPRRSAAAMMHDPRPPVGLLGPALDFLEHLWRLNHALERLSGRMTKVLGVTAQQRLVIRCIGRFPGITAGQLARLLHLDPGTVSATLKRLEAQGILVRRRDRRDLRCVTLRLTSKGHGLDRPSAGTVEHAVRRLLRAVDHRKITASTDVLGRLVALLLSEAR